MTLCTLPFLSTWTLPNCFLGSKLSSCEAENSAIGSISVRKRAYPDASHSDEISVIRLFLSKGLKAHGAWIVKWCLSRKICHSRGHFGIPEDALLISSEGRKTLCVVKDAAVGRKQSFFLFRSFWHSVFFFNAVWKPEWNNNVKIKFLCPRFLTSCQSCNTAQTRNQPCKIQKF